MQILKLINLQTVKLKKMKKIDLKGKKIILSKNERKEKLDKELLSHFILPTAKEKNVYEEKIKKLEKQIEELNITDEIRKKDKSELTDEEYDKLYDEYVYKGLIEAEKSGIENGTCDIKYLKEYLEALYGVKLE